MILHTTLEFEMSDLITDIICSGQKDWSDAPNWKVFCGVRMHPYSLISILFLVYILRIEWKAIVHKVVFIVMSFFVWPVLRYMSNEHLLFPEKDCWKRRHRPSCIKKSHSFCCWLFKIHQLLHFEHPVVSVMLQSANWVIFQVITGVIAQVIPF